MPLQTDVSQIVTQSAESQKSGVIDAGAVPLESILCTEELRRRRSRPPDYQKENGALLVLSNALADTPRTVLQTLADTILEVCQSGSAGISLLTTDEGEAKFCWPAIAGEWKQHIGGGTPRNFGPCGDVLDCNTPLLFRNVALRYTYFQTVTPAVEEALLVPFYVRGKAVGTIWAVAHNSQRKFDAEDERLMLSLGRFASSAYQLLTSLDALNLGLARGEKKELALRLSNTKLESLIEERTGALRKLTISLLQSQDEERRRFGRNLHDSIGQYLTIIKMNLDAMNGLGRGDLKQPELLSQCLHAVEECLKETRTISYLLHPPLLDEAGFESAARWYVDGFAQRGGIQAKLSFPEKMDRLTRSVELALFRILQESLTNVHRHSGSPTVEIKIEVDAERVSLAVRDAGRGIPHRVMEQFQRSGNAGVGLAGMRARLVDLGGELRVQSDEKGTVLQATIPLHVGTRRQPQRESAA
ncbi:MAG: multi-sensor signal transduction histidine kinase [Candidatus Sulfotelmatobacter sp.]|nr:multi-sensor signal transduction histidine kinase [Candidatus Sulfotelmatobacter sp.]